MYILHMYHMYCYIPATPSQPAPAVRFSILISTCPAIRSLPYQFGIASGAQFGMYFGRVV